MKDGVAKGAPSPSYQIYSKSKFLSESPMKTGNEVVEPSAAPKTEEVVGTEEKEESWWIDEGTGNENEDEVFGDGTANKAGKKPKG